MELIKASIPRYNVSQLNDLAIATKEIAEMPTVTPIVDSTDDTTEVALYADQNNVSETNSKGEPQMYTKSGDSYFPIMVDLGGLNQNPNQPVPMTEEEKRKRTIIIASVVLLLLIVLVSIISLKNRK